MSRIFVSHSSKDNRQSQALRAWLVAQDPPLATEIFLDLDTDTGLKPGVKWKTVLVSANSRCEAVICLLSNNWESSAECLAEYRTAENLGKQILCARLEEGTGEHTSEWQHTNLFVDGLAPEEVETIPVSGGPPVQFAKTGLRQLREAIRGVGVAANNFVWPPPAQPDRAPFRGWEPFEEVDAGVFFGRDAQIVRALDMLRGMRITGVDSLFVVLGPSGSGKSSFLRAGLLPRLRREDRHFVLLDILRPERHALSGDTGLAHAICAGRRRLGFEQPALGDIEVACSADPAAVRALLAECRHAAARRLPDAGPDAPLPTLVLPLDQAEELFTADAGAEASAFLRLIAELARPDADGQQLGLIVAGTIRTDRYEVMQTAPELAELTSEVFDDLKPMPDNQFRAVITGPAERASAAGHRLGIAPDLINQLLEDAAEGGDALPLLALTLRRLYDRYFVTGELTLANYQAMGGTARVVQSAVDEVLAADPQQRQRQLSALRAAFVPWLATINRDNDQPMRRVARFTDLPESSRPLIAAFVEKRLLVQDQRGTDVVVEVALESLLRQWDELAGWLREERQHLIAADDIERAATAWHTHQEDTAWLLTGTRLADAETLTTRTGYHDRLAQQPTRDYLAASRQTENQRQAKEEEQRQAELHRAQESQRVAEAHANDLRRRSRILRAVLACTAIVAVIAVISAVVAVVEIHRATREAHDALAAQLEAEASEIFSGVTPDSAIHALAEALAAHRLRLSPHASRLHPNTERSALYTAAAALNSTRAILSTPASASSVAFSPDGHTIAAGIGDKTVRLWSLTDPAHPRPLGQPLTGHSDRVWGVAFSPDGRTLASSSSDKSVRLWNLTDPARPTPLGPPLQGHTDTIWSVAFSPDGHTLASGSNDNTVRLWNLTDPAHPSDLGPPLRGHTDTIWSVAFSPDGHTLASGSDDNTVGLWNVTDPAHPQQLDQLRAPRTSESADSAVDSVAFDPVGHTLASGHANGLVWLWDLTDPAHPQPISPLPGHTSFLESVTFSPDGGTLASSSADNTLQLWNVSDPAHPASLGQPLRGQTSTIYGVAFSPDGRTVVSGAGDDTLRLWNLDIASPRQGHTNGVLSVASRPVGQTLASGGGDATVRLWDLADPAHPQPLGNPLQGHRDAVWSVAFSPDGLILASASNDSTVRLWNVNDPAHPEPLGQPLLGHSGPVYSVAFSPDGRIVASAGNDGTVRLWNLTDPAHPQPPGGQVLQGHTNAALSVAFSPDGQTLASAGADHDVRLWSLTDPAHPQPPGGQILQGHTDAVLTVAFSPDGHVLASGSNDSTVRLWNVIDPAHAKQLGQPLKGHTNGVSSVAFGPDRETLASASIDSTVRLWDLSDPSHARSLGLPLQGHIGEVSSVAFSPDRRTLVSGGRDSSVRLWPTPDSTTATATLCSKLATNISQREWRDWISTSVDYIKLCKELPVPAD